MLSLFFLLFLLFPAQVLAFHFSFNPPSECDDIGLTWTGALTSPVSLQQYSILIFRRDPAVQAAYHPCMKYPHAINPI